MYISLKDGSENYFWDDAKEIMYKVSEGILSRISANLHAFERFRPYLYIVEEMEKLPKDLEIEDEVKKSNELVGL